MRSEAFTVVKIQDKEIFCTVMSRSVVWLPSWRWR